MKSLIPVRITTGKHAGLVVMHTREEYERLWNGVDQEAAELLGREDDLDVGEDDCRCFHDSGERGGA